MYEYSLAGLGVKGIIQGVVRVEFDQIEMIAEEGFFRVQTPRQARAAVKPPIYLFSIFSFISKA